MDRRTVLAGLAGVVVSGCEGASSVIAALQPDRGGGVLTLELDTAELRARRLDQASDEMADGLRAATPPVRYSGRGRLGDAARIRPADPADIEHALSALATLAAPTGDFTLSVTEDGFVEARLTPTALATLNNSALDATVEVLGRRLDPARLGIVRVERRLDQIVVAALDGSRPEALSARIGPVGLLTFHLVREVDSADAERPPAGAFFAAPRAGLGDSGEFVEERPLLTGERLIRVTPTADARTGEMLLSFELDDTGKAAFCTITREHTNRRFAILLDKQVLTAPLIVEPICGGSGQISGNFTAQSASELAAMLNAGAYRAPVIVVASAMRAPDAPLPWGEPVR